jgi:hypothetical protein
MSDDEDLFGSDDEKDVKISETAKGQGSEEDEAPGPTSASKKKAVSFLDDDDDDDDKIMEGTAPGDDQVKDEYADLFGEGEETAVLSKKRSTSALHISATPDLPEHAHAMLVRMPNVLKIQEQPFDELAYSKEEDMEAIGRVALGVRYRVQKDADGNVVLDASGKPIFESNARLVKMKNGSVQIVMGSSVYECIQQPVESSFLYMQKVSLINGEKKTALELVGAIGTRTSIQPTSISDESRRLLAKTPKEENKKVKRIETLRIQDQAMQKRPEAYMLELAKEEEAKIKIVRKQKSDRAETGGYSQGRIRMNADFLTADEGLYDDTNLSDIKQGRKQPRRNARADSEEEDSSDDDDEDDDLEGFIVKGKDDDDEDEDDGPRYFRKDGKKPPKKAAKAKPKEDEEDEDEDEDEEEEEDSSDDDDDDDDDVAPKPSSKRPRPQKETKIAADDEVDKGDDDEAEETSNLPARKVKRMVIDDDDDE